MCKQSLEEGQQNPQILMGMRDKTSTLGKFCSLSSKVCRVEILRGNKEKNADDTAALLLLIFH